MKSTGEVMGVGDSFALAFAKAFLGAGKQIKRRGKAFLSVREVDKRHIPEIAKLLIDLGFEIVATHGTAKVIESQNMPCQHINKVTEGRPHIVDMIKNNEIDFIINTTQGEQAIKDSYTIRRSALQQKVPYTTTVAGG